MGRLGKEAKRRKLTRFKIVHGVKAKDKMIKAMHKALDNKTISSASWKQIKRENGKPYNMWQFVIVRKNLPKKRKKRKKKR